MGLAGTSIEVAVLDADRQFQCLFVRAFPGQQRRWVRLGCCTDSVGLRARGALSKVGADFCPAAAGAAGDGWRRRRVPGTGRFARQQLGATADSQRLLPGRPGDLRRRCLGTNRGVCVAEATRLRTRLLVFGSGWAHSVLGGTGARTAWRPSSPGPARPPLPADPAGPGAAASGRKRPARLGPGTPEHAGASTAPQPPAARRRLRRRPLDRVQLGRPVPGEGAASASLRHTLGASGQCGASA